MEERGPNEEGIEGRGWKRAISKDVAGSNCCWKGSSGRGQMTTSKSTAVHTATSMAAPTATILQRVRLYLPVRTPVLDAVDQSYRSIFSGISLSTIEPPIGGGPPMTACRLGFGNETPLADVPRHFICCHHHWSPLHSSIINSSACCRQYHIFLYPQTGTRMHLYIYINIQALAATHTQMYTRIRSQALKIYALLGPRQFQRAVYSLTYSNSIELLYKQGMKRAYSTCHHMPLRRNWATRTGCRQSPLIKKNDNNDMRERIIA